MYAIYSEGNLLTQDDVEALKKLLKERDSSLPLEGISCDVLTTDSSGKVSTTLEEVQQSLRQRGLDDFADNLKEKLEESELIKILSYQCRTIYDISIYLFIQVCLHTCTHITNLITACTCTNLKTD